MSGYVGLAITITMALVFTVSAFVLAVPTLGWMAAVSWAISGVAAFGIAYNHAEYVNFWQNWASYLALVVFLAFTTVMILASIGWKDKNEKDEIPEEEEEEASARATDDERNDDRWQRRRNTILKSIDVRRERSRQRKAHQAIRKTNARIARGE